MLEETKAKSKPKPKTPIMRIILYLFIIVVLLLSGFPKLRSYIPVALVNKIADKFNFSSSEQKTEKDKSSTLTASQRMISATQECKVNGILYSKEKPSVMIGKNIYYLNDLVCGGKIIEISPDKVKINFQDKEEVYGVGNVIAQKTNLAPSRSLEKR